MSTVEVARDLDILRAVVGDPKLTYYGASYGTYIGAIYAELFPRRVGRLVLDGAVDPTLSATKAGLRQAAGFQTALEAYVDDCVATGDCPLGSDRREVIVRLRTFLDDLDQNPLDTGDPERPLTEALGFTGVVAPLYNQDYWPLLTEALTAAAQGDGSVLLRLGRCLSSPRKRPLSRQHDPGELRGQVPRRSSAPHPSTDSAVRAAIRAGVAGVRPDLRLVDARLLGVAYPAGAAAAGHRRRGRRADRRRRHHP
ncbi:MAG TPA: alpha/beta fold hydrolase [Nocardioidaceae bacterium]|nr:alpha/beta fold hydrolase [Nocardioidaceae bacterium]